jgi:hypothetical protein
VSKGYATARDHHPEAVLPDSRASNAARRDSGPGALLIAPDRHSFVLRANPGMRLRLIQRVRSDVAAHFSPLVAV